MKRWQELILERRVASVRESRARMRQEAMSFRAEVCPSQFYGGSFTKKTEHAAFLLGRAIYERRQAELASRLVLEWREGGAR